MQPLSNSNNNKLVHLYNICHKNKQSPSGLNIARIACNIMLNPVTSTNVICSLK